MKNNKKDTSRRSYCSPQVELFYVSRGLNVLNTASLYSTLPDFEDGGDTEGNDYDFNGFDDY